MENSQPEKRKRGRPRKVVVEHTHTAFATVKNDGGREFTVPIKLGSRIDSLGEVKDVEVIKEKKVPPSELLIEDVKTALKNNRGYITFAAYELGTTPKNLKKVIEEHEELQDIIETERETDLDVGESELMGMVKNHSINKLGATCFLLKCRGKSRGYIESQKFELNGNAGAVQINLVNFTEADVMNRQKSLGGKQKEFNAEADSNIASE